MISTYFTTPPEARRQIGALSFEIRMRDDSMESRAGGRSFPDGSTLIVDPKAKPEAGQFVLAWSVKRWDSAIVRQLVIERGKRYLKPLNENYAAEPPWPEGKIIGVIKRSAHAEDF